MFFLEYYGMLSGGALGSLTIGLATANFWERGQPRCGSLGASLSFSAEGMLGNGLGNSHGPFSMLVLPGRGRALLLSSCSYMPGL